jgi:hypothetical protein
VADQSMRESRKIRDGKSHSIKNSALPAPSGRSKARR